VRIAVIGTGRMGRGFATALSGRLDGAVVDDVSVP
jgi:3-hydroxyisobutyrate dehydrogenase-like beta-hydroxyacid dehydrogenase